MAKLYTIIQIPACRSDGRDSQVFCVGEVVKRVMFPDVNR